MRVLSLRVGALLVLLVALTVAALTVRLPDVDTVRSQFVALGPSAPLAFVVVYALVVPAPIPKSVLTTVAGVVFGVPLGVPLVVVGATCGAILAFLLARGLGRDAVDRLAQGRLDRVDEAVERHGVLAALVVRLIPVLPFTLLNYACGVTTMRVRHYALGTAVGVVPGSTALVALGSSGARISLWVPVLTSVTLALVSLLVGAVWQHRGRAPAKVRAGAAAAAPVLSAAPAPTD